MEFSTEEQVFEYFCEFKATRNSIKRDVEYLKQWMKQEPHLPEVEDDDVLTNFLLRGKNNVERAKKLIDTYYTARARMPELFQNRGNQLRNTIESIRKIALFFALPRLTPDGRRLMLFYIREHDNSDQLPNAMDFMKTAQMVFDVGLKSDKIRGVTMIYDFGNITTSFLKSFFSTVRIALTMQSKINPIRYNRIYLLNVPPYALPLVSFGTSFVKKQKERAVIWTKETKQLSEVLPKQCLPQEYGGSLPSVLENFDTYFDHAQKYLDWFEEQDDVKADLSKKADLLADEAFRGVDGSFRKLSID